MDTAEKRVNKIFDSMDKVGFDLLIYFTFFFEEDITFTVNFKQLK